MYTIEKIADLIHDDKLLKQALSLSHHGRSAPYERLEFLGDRVLGLAISALLFERFPDEKEGSLAMRFTLLVREKTLARVARQIGLPVALVTRENELRQNESILSDVCEAVLGALFLTRGFETVQRVVRDLWTPLMLTPPTELKDAKSRLQEWAMAQQLGLPIYDVTDRTGPQHAPVFTVSVSVGDWAAVGVGSSKKAAQEAAAENLWTEMKGASND